MARVLSGARHVHFVGIGGIGMSGLAYILKERGFKVTGSDLHSGAMFKRLASFGIKCHQGHRPKNIGTTDLVVISSAIRDQNPEVIEAKRRQIKILQRAELLAAVFADKRLIAVTGTHGKTSTTAMITSVLLAADMDPSVMVGGIIHELGFNARVGKSDLALVEADESDKSLLHLSPAFGLVTNLELEHVDCYSSLEELRQTTLTFLHRVMQEQGKPRIFLNGDDPNLQIVAQRLHRERYHTFGLTDGLDTQGVIIQGTRESSFELFHRKERACKIELKMGGKHNVYNALACGTLCLELGISPSVIEKAMKNYEGVKRRLELKGNVKGIRIFDDYAHHPTEIAAVLSALRSRTDGKVFAVFQPHRYSRFAFLYKDFLNSFGNADFVVILPVYAAFERDMRGIDVKDFEKELTEKGKKCQFIPTFSEAINFLHQQTTEGDSIVTLGAGDVCRLGDEIVEGAFV
jgi:UDP-N-acetylmuramate--alanine ligase